MKFRFGPIRFGESTPEGGVAVTSQPSPKVEQSPRLRSPISSPKEEVLESRETSSERKIGHGVTDSSFIELVDDGKAVFKTIDYKAERAAYLFDLFLGLKLVPPTVIRKVNNREGSAQEFIPDSTVGGECSMHELSLCQEKLMKLWVFDLIIGNKDRHNGNFLLKDGEVYAIDNGRSFGYRSYTGNFRRKIILNPDYRNRSVRDSHLTFFGQDLPQNLIDLLKSFSENVKEQEILQDLLGEMVGREVARSVIRRIKTISTLLTKKGLIPDKNSIRLKS